MVKKFLLEREVTEKLALYEQTKSKEIRDEIIINYMYIVTKMAEKIAAKTGFRKDDLEGYGYEGLIRAINHLNPKIEKSRINYITQSVRRTIFDGFQELRQFGGNRTTNAYLLARHQVEEESGRTIQEDPSLVDKILDLLIERKVIDKKNREENKTRILLDSAKNINEYKQSKELIDETSLDSYLIEQERKQELLSLLEILSPRDQAIIKARFGIDGTCETLESLAEKFKITSQGIEKVEKRSLDKLRSNTKVKKSHEYLEE